MRSRRRTAVGAIGAIVASVLVGPAASRAVAADHPVAGCPAGRASLSVARRARGVTALGPFAIAVGARGMTVRADGRVLWASAPGVPFVGAARGAAAFTGAGGFFSVQAAFSQCWRAQRIAAVRAGRGTVTVSGGLGAGARFAVTFRRASSVRLAMTVRVRGPGATTVLLTTASPRGETVHGFGAMTRWNLKGGVIPVITREQGVGRGEPGVTQAEDQLIPPQGGAYNTTYAVVPQYLTSSDRGFFWTDDQYGVFDLTRADRIAAQLWSTVMPTPVATPRWPRPPCTGRPSCWSVGRR